ncbi:MAG: hypothetical protein Edafosvirus36_3 [Edafosvirus sp.]|uniref:Uncharacterized protein n=1 Tax=Edafosvirus sp. TaxID=2487765 RepID=A0A3G4ZZ10_9VIRU|nr:MAG: hypothetical protein Edafosvirus36_3 [Edafosvirus sp.]
MADEIDIIGNIDEKHIIDKIKESYVRKELIINNINLFDVYLMTEKKNYRILFSGKKLKINSLKVKIPFGTEKYNNKDIVNIELINYKKTNGNYNFYSSIKQIDYIFKHLLEDDIHNNLKNTLPYGFEKEIAGKHYMSCIKENENVKFNPLLRTHLKNTVITKNNNHMTKFEIKGTYAKVELELGSLWTTPTNYGIIWFINKISIY